MRGTLLGAWFWGYSKGLVVVAVTGLAACSGDDKETEGAGSMSDGSTTEESTTAATGSSSASTTAGTTASGSMSMSDSNSAGTTDATTTTVGVSESETSPGTTDSTATTAMTSDATTDGTTDGTTTDSTTDGTTDGTTTDGTTTGGVEPPEWLLSINNQTRYLQKVSIVDAKTTDLCKLPNNTSYPSLTFSRSNNLYASAGGQALDLIDPCTCEVQSIGSYGMGITGVNGITSDQGTELYGVASTQDISIAIDTGSGLASPLGALGVDFGTGGATWSDALKGLYAIDGNTDYLYTIDTGTGMATPQVKLSYNFGTVGIELHPGNEVIYACSSGPDLFKVDPKTGAVTSIGKMAQTSCSNLAAPYAPVECIGD